MSDMLDLPLITFLVLGFAVFMYTLMDGFDLGIGIILPLQRDAAARDQMINAIAPVWDGNETWLVMGGVLLMAGFPQAFATLLPALYVPVVLMLLGLVCRGVAFEFRFKTTRGRPAWDLAFAAGSALAAFSQGLMLATIIDGQLPADGRLQVSIFSLLVALGLMAAYVLLGLSFLHGKGDQALNHWCARLGRRALIGVALFLALISLWTPLLHAHVAQRWFAADTFVWLWPLPLLTAALLGAIDHGFKRGHALLPFRACIGVFLLGFAGLTVSLFPYLVPQQLDLWQAAAHPRSLAFVLVGVVLLMPVILGYTWWSYHVFAGRVQGGYH